MTSAVAQIQFAAEFVTFLVAAAGLALVLLRNELTTRRPPERLALTLGFFATALAAFGHGSLLLNGDLEGIVIALRLLGIVGLGIGSIWWWRGHGVARQLLWIGLVGTAVAVFLQVIGAGRASDAALAAGSIMIGGALLVASRHSVAARVAASAAGTLLLVVLVLAVALSAVLSSSVEREELNRLQSRANTEANLATSSFVAEEPTARLVGAFLLLGLTQRQLTTAGQVTSLLGELGGSSSSVYPGGGFEVLVPVTSSPGVGARIVGEVGISLKSGIAVEVAGLPDAQPTCIPSGSGSDYLIGSQLLAVAAYTLCLNDIPILVVVRVSPIDDTYLIGRQEDDETQALAIVGSNAVVAKVGAGPSNQSLVSVEAAVLASKGGINRVIGSQYVAAQPIKQANGLILGAMVVSTPTSTVVKTRNQLFRTLFLIALGGTLIALGLAVVIGDRITASLRRLTLVAESIQKGRRGERSGITSDDEVGVLGAAFDSMADSIEEQTRALRAAADDETRLRSRLEAVVAGMGDALVAVDARGKITDFNQSAEEMTGVTAAQAVGRLVDEVVMLVNEDGASIGPRLRTPSPSRWGMVVTAVDLSGAEFPVAISAGALRGPGNELVGQVLVVRDLRREREVERMKTEFLSRVGHELRTPLTGIMGYAEFLLRRSVSAEAALVCYGEIVESAKRLLRVVEMLEFFASSGAGRVLLRPEPLDVHQLIDGVLTPWTERLVAPSTISRLVDGPLPEITGDRRWLALAIDELIDNAVKFSPGGAQVTVTAGIVRIRPPNELPRFVGPGASTSSTNGKLTIPVLEIAVIDRGKGMTAEEQATAFGEFVQGDGSDTRQFGGLGLGLSLVQRVVEGHGGNVRCTSSPGQGSTFTIVLPLPPSLEPETPSQERAVEPAVEPKVEPTTEPASTPESAVGEAGPQLQSVST